MSLSDLILAAETEEAELVAAKEALASASAELATAQAAAKAAQGNVDTANGSVNKERDETVIAWRAVIAEIETRIASF